MKIAILLTTLALSLPAQTRTSAQPDLMMKYQSARGFFESVWKNAFARYGVTYVGPKYAEFTTPTGPCNGPPPAYYCSTDDTIYYQRAMLVEIQNAAAARLGTDGDYAALVILAHELGHAVAFRLKDITPFSEYRENRADCMAGVATREAARTKALDPGDYQEAIFAMAIAGQQGIRTLIDPRTHGSPEQRVTNFKAGYERGPSACDLDIIFRRFKEGSTPKTR